MTTQSIPFSLPTLQHVLTLQVRIGQPDWMGQSIDGLRSNYRIVGGRFEGPQLSGQVLAGGADFFVVRPDGTGEMNATYSLLTDEGELINLHNTGTLRISPKGQDLEQRGIWPIPDSEYHCTCTPRFQVPQGRLSWLAQTAFIGQVRYPSGEDVEVQVYKLASPGPGV